MTKAATKAERRRRKRQITLAGGETRVRPATRGPRPAEPPADAVALAVRARRTGCTVEDARDVLAADDMGRCIRAMRSGIEDRRALLTVWQGISASWANYAARVLGKAATPQAASLPMLPEPMETDPSLRVDLRTADERDEAAIRSWDSWRDAFNALPVAESLAITGAVYNTGAVLWDADKLQPTRHGAMAVKALAMLHEKRAGRRNFPLAIGK